MLKPFSSSNCWNTARKYNYNIVQCNLWARQTWITSVKIAWTETLEVLPFILVSWAHKATPAPRSFLISCVPIWFSVIPESSTRAVWQLPAETSSFEAGETWREIVMCQCLSTKTVTVPDHWRTGVRFLADAKDFSSSLFVQTSSEAQPVSYQWIPGVLPRR
jgi:hypothetical protein